MYYEINVALHGEHLFATHERSITSIERLAAILKLFKKKFPESKGYSVSATEIKKYGTVLPVEEVIDYYVVREIKEGK